MKTLPQTINIIWIAIFILTTFMPPYMTAAQRACTQAALKDVQVAILDCGSNTNSTYTCASFLPGDNNEEKIWNFLINKGLADFQAAGVMGNLAEESGFKPDEQENSVAWPKGGWGLAQWTGGRRITLRDAVLAAGLPYTNEATPTDKIDSLLEFEMEFLYNESINRGIRKPGLPSGKNTDFIKDATIEWEGLKNTTNVEEATLFWEWNFERPRVINQIKRVETAKSILARFRGVSDSTGSQDCLAILEGNPEAQDTSHLQCPEGTTDAGIEQDYGVGRVPTVKIRLCNIKGVTQVNAIIANQTLAMLSDAETDNEILRGDSWRSYDEQAQLRIDNGCPDLDKSSSSTCRVPTAPAGRGYHEVGLAIDFNNMCFPEKVCPSSSAWVWLTNNAEKYGFSKLKSEAWHWSPGGK